MKIIKLLIFFFALSSCSQYFGSIDTDYEPTKEVADIFSKYQDETYLTEISIDEIIYPKISKLINNLNLSNIVKISNIDKNSKIIFSRNKIYLNKDNSVHIFNINEKKKISKIDLDLNKDENVIHFFQFKDSIYLITNYSRIFLLYAEKAEIIIDFSIYINKAPILIEDRLILISVFGDVYLINLNNNSLVQKDNFKSNPGISTKSNFFYDSSYLYYLFNTNTLLTFNLSNLELSNNYILEDLNILSSLGVFNELVDAPFTYNDYLYFLDRSGKISVFNPQSSDILWETDINSTILDYLFSKNGYLILLSFEKIYILSDNGNLIYEYKHNKDSPISITSLQDNLFLFTSKGINSISLNQSSKNIFYKNKFTNNIDIYYQDENIYLKDDKSLFQLSE